MLTYAARRLAALLPTMFAVMVIVFAASRAMPGDPIGTMLSDHSADVVMAARLRGEYGLDRPLSEQFFVYIGEVLRGDFGLSYRYLHMHVANVIADGLRVSLTLASLALLLAVPAGVGAGILAALRHDRWADSVTTGAMIAALSLPNFAMATFLVYFFSVRLRLLPVAGWGEPGQAVLPVVVLALPAAAYIGRLTRTFMLEVLRQDYIRTARAKGLPGRAVVLEHALPNTLVPLSTSVGIIFGGMLSATFVVETIFNIPGLGRLAIDSIFARDYPVITAIVLLFTLFYSLINLAVDLLYAAIDPRIRAAAP
jgi:ABC-type dipeptide/oligopeptide/nickel transport system permease component